MNLRKAEGAPHYLAFEGIEGAGKSTIATQVQSLLARDSVEVVAVREPGGTPTGERVRDVLLDPSGTVTRWTEALLFAASRAQLAEEVIRPALAGGAWVVSDRSVYSSLAYQGGGRGLGIDRVRAVNEPGLQGTWPELVVLLDVVPATGLSRQHVVDRIGAESEEFLERVADAFRELAAGEPDRFVIIDAMRSVDDVVAAAYAAVEGRW